MYMRDFSGIKSEGQLYNMEQGYRQEREESHGLPPPPVCTDEPPKRGGKSLINLDFLRNIRIDDLLLIGIGILLLFDSDSDNDLLVLLILLTVLL